jgi:hypothetical protein
MVYIKAALLCLVIFFLTEREYDFAGWASCKIAINKTVDNKDLINKTNPKMSPSQDF